MRILFIPKYAISSGSTSKHRNKKLASFTLISALIFSCAMAVPYVSAALFPEYRMTLGALGQIINSLGTILLLFLVDPILYKHMDNNQLKENLHGYYVGRFLGFLLGGSVLFIIAMNIREIGL
jgi:predicted anti-sigma-YlaC factor YlaD